VYWCLLERLPGSEAGHARVDALSTGCPLASSGWPPAALQRQRDVAACRGRQQQGRAGEGEGAGTAERGRSMNNNRGGSMQHSAPRKRQEREVPLFTVYTSPVHSLRCTLEFYILHTPVVRNTQMGRPRIKWRSRRRRRQEEAEEASARAPNVEVPTDNNRAGRRTQSLQLTTYLHSSSSL
jgi:hypothetical protein